MKFMRKTFSLITMVGVVLTLGMVSVGCNDTTEPPQCTVSFTPGRGDGSPVNQTVDVGTLINLPNQGNMTAPVGETFDGWKDGGGTPYQVGDSYTVTANVLFTAQWKTESVLPAGYTVSYNANGGSGTPPASQIVASGVSVYVAGQGDLSYAKKIFSGWNTNADGTGTTYAAGASLTLTADITLYAQWVDESVPTYTVTYNANGGSGTPPTSQTVASGVNVYIVGQGDLSYTGKIFSGWNTNTDGSGTTYTAGASLTLTTNTTLYAQWVGESYTVTYNSNGGSGTPPTSQTVASGVNVYIAGQGDLSYTGKNFSGWNTNADGTGTTYAAGASLTLTVNTTLYAQWKTDDDGGGIEFRANERYQTEPEANPPVVSALNLGTSKYFTVYLGKVLNVPVIWQDTYWYRGTGYPNPTWSFSEEQSEQFTETESASQLNSNAVSKGSSQENGVETSAGFSIKNKITAGIEVGGFGVKAKAEASLETAIEANVAKHWSTTSSHSVTDISEVSKTFETSKTKYKASSKSLSYTFGVNGEVPGDYRYTLFKTCDVYVTVVFDATNKLIARYTTVLARPEEYYGFDYSEHGAGFKKTGDGDLLTLTDDYIQYLSTRSTTDIPIEDDPDLPPTPPIDPPIVLPLDVWGGKLSYSYKVLSAGTISYSLTGGGAGGAGGAALRDVSWWYWWDTKSKVDVGWSLDGGPTNLLLNGTKINSANGGVGVNGPDHTADSDAPWKSNGVKGNDGKTISGTLSVAVGDIITIEVGWGGGGSGGVANNDTDKSISSDYNSSSNRAEKTTGSAGSYSGTSANATRGGVGAMHSLIFPSSDILSYLEKGSSSPNLKDSPEAFGGDAKGKGGSAGQANEIGGVYASGGGGGAAGGFILDSSNANLMEME
ncbi:hypothetical protein AGMMS4957_13650 [Bacteroidia bacterium]|nr:hypothetical protein AGMMS4957_13650 [Bacteroidia bacterium]